MEVFMRKRIIFVMVVALAIFALSACTLLNKNPDNKPDAPEKYTYTFTMACIIKEIIN